MGERLVSLLWVSTNRMSSRLKRCGQSTPDTSTGDILSLPSDGHRLSKIMPIKVAIGFLGEYPRGRSGIINLGGGQPGGTRPAAKVIVVVAPCFHRDDERLPHADRFTPSIGQTGRIERAGWCRSARCAGGARGA